MLPLLLLGVVQAASVPPDVPASEQLASAPAPATSAPDPTVVLNRHAGLAMNRAATRIATIDSQQGAAAPSARHGVIVVRDAGGKVLGRLDPCKECRYEGLSWSPDGTRLAFVASGGGTATLYVAERPNGTRRITSVKGLAAVPRWSPDGTTIAFLATPDATKESGATQPGTRQVGLIGERADSRRIATVPLAGGDYRLVSPAGTYVYEYDWLPDGSGFAGTAAEGNGDNQWWVASLRAFPIAGAMRVIAAPAMQINMPRVAADGRSVAFIGGLMSDYGSIGGDVYTVPLAGGTPRDLTPGYKASFTSIAWRAGHIVATLIQGGSTGTATIDPAGGVADVAVMPASIEAGDGHVALDETGRIGALVAESFTEAPHVDFGPLGAMHAIVTDNAALRSTITARDVRWKSGGFDVQGWLMAPAPGTGTAAAAKGNGAAAAAAGGRKPMIVIVHGGPSSAVTPRFPWGFGGATTFTNAGWYVFQPNPRGSFGQGEAFTRANIKDFGGGDLKDILAGVDEVERIAPVDDKRLGITGGSYGGFMTMWAVTQTNRFKAAAAGAGVSDWVAYYGQNGIDQWMIPFFGASAYDDYRTYDRMSPIRYIRNAHTPTFIYVGERDIECPPAQSLEYWHGLRAMGVPTALMIYEGEGHGLRQPANIADLQRRTMEWFGTYLR